LLFEPLKIYKTGKRQARKFMKFNITLLTILLFGLSVFGQTVTENGDRNKPAKEIFSGIINAKRQNNRLIIISPDDVSRLSPAERNTLLTPQGACDTALPINFGQTLNGQLSSADCRLDDGSYADFYAFNGTKGQTITVLLNSGDFDAYLVLGNQDGSFIIEDDDGGGGTNSKITTTLPTTGVYIILANSFDPNTFGNYTLALSEATSSCTYSLTPTSATVPAAGGTFTFAVNTQAGCQWTAMSNSPFISTGSSGTGTGTVSYTVVPNNTAAIRTGAITVGGQTFTVTQSPGACTYSLNPSSVNVPATQTSGTFTVTTQAGCPLSVSSNASWITVTSAGVNTSGFGTVAFSVVANTGAARTGTITAGGQVFTVNQSAAAVAARKTPFDYDGDGKADVSVFRPSNGVWYLLNSQTGFSAVQFGIATDRIVPADYDGDGKTDIAVYRDNTWYLQRSALGFASVQFGTAGDIPFPADFDGDGKSELVVYRPSTGNWYTLNLVNNAFTSAQFGTAEDKPVAADYDGDGRADYAVYRPSNGVWYIQRSRDGFSAVQFGVASDKPVVGDYDGDGRADQAVYRPDNGTWYINRSGQGFTSVQFGISTDLPAPADYDGDGKTDVAVFRPSNGGNWYINRSAQGFASVQFGASGDKPTPNAFVP